MTTTWENTHEFVDTETGEVLRSETIATIKSEEPDYVKLYIKAWCEFKQVKGINNQVLLEILPYMTYASEGQIIGFTPVIKRQIAKKLGWKESNALSRFNHEIKKIEKAGVVTNIGYSTYAVNPQLIGKGSWKDIRKLRATFDLETGEVTHDYSKAAAMSE